MSGIKVSIGLLAHNEACGITSSLRSLLRQSLVCDGRDDIRAVEIVCVPNGCTDRTAEVTRRTLETYCSNRTVAWRVCELDEAGKPNAWNQFVHDLSDQSADFLILMDADIDLLSPNVLTSLIDALAESPEAYASVGMPLKRVGPKGKRTAAGRLSLSISEISLAGPPALNGALYCVRGSILRRIWLPRELLIEDGFIKAMLVTDFFTGPGQPARLRRACDAVYEFEPYLRIRELFRHQRRMALGTAVNALLYSRLWALPDGEDAGGYARRQSELDRNWFDAMLCEQIQKRRWWVFPEGMFLHLLLERFRKLRHLPFGAAVRKFPLVLGAMLFELPVLLAANHSLRRKELRW